MNDVPVFFINSSFLSYEDFQQKIDRNEHHILYFLAVLNKLRNTGQPFEMIKEWVEASRFSHFSTNCLYLYRWLITDGYEKFEDSEIELFFNFLNIIRVTDFAATQVKWGIVFMSRETLDKSFERFWMENILKYFNLEAKESFTLTELSNYFMVFHTGLKQFFEKKWPANMTEAQEIILNNYLSLVNRFPELEEIFGIAIEKDIFRLYQLRKEDVDG
jgi:hypothetical protein